MIFTSQMGRRVGKNLVEFDFVGGNGVVADLVAFENFFAEKLKNERDDGAHGFKVGTIAGSGVDCAGNLRAW